MSVEILTKITCAHQQFMKMQSSENRTKTHIQTVVSSSGQSYLKMPGSSLACSYPLRVSDRGASETSLTHSSMFQFFKSTSFFDQQMPWSKHPDDSQNVGKSREGRQSFQKEAPLFDDLFAFQIMEEYFRNVLLGDLAIKLRV